MYEIDQYKQKFGVDLGSPVVPYGAHDIQPVFKTSLPNEQELNGKLTTFESVKDLSSL